LLFFAGFSAAVADAFLGGRLRQGGFLLLLAPEAYRTCQLGTRLRVVRRHHRVIERKAPFGPVAFGGHAANGEVPPERLVGLAVLEADDEIRRDRLPDRNGGFGLLGGGGSGRTGDGGQCPVDVIDDPDDVSALTCTRRTRRRCGPSCARRRRRRQRRWPPEEYPCDKNVLSAEGASPSRREAPTTMPSIWSGRFTGGFLPNSVREVTLPKRIKAHRIVDLSRISAQPEPFKGIARS